MAIYHCGVKTHSRSDTSANHAVRSAAYRAGAKLVDELSGNIYNYSYKSEVTYSEIMLPANAPEWASSRTLLWNNVEKSENRKDAQLFREVEVALPHELTDEQNQELLREYSRIFTKDGMIVDLSIHGLAHNQHCHMMLTLRDIINGEFGNKNREWNDKKKLEAWRKSWATLVNKHLAKAGFNITVDHRSYEKQGLDIVPTVHEGREGIGGHNKEKVSARRQRNRTVREYNKNRSDLKRFEAESNEIDAQIKEIDLKIEELKKSESIKSNDPTPVATGVQSKVTPDIPSPPVANNGATLVSIRQKILQSVKPVQPSKSTAMMVYEAPRPKIGTIPGINRNLSINLPPKPIEAARCYALRSLFGPKIDFEFNARLKAMRHIGKNYSWEAFYLDIQDTVNERHGVNLTWWRAYTKMVYNKYPNKLTDIYMLAPKKYINNVDEYLGLLAGDIPKKKEAPPTNFNTGQSANPNIDSPQPQQNPGKIPWTQMPEEPKPSNFNPSNTMPPPSHRPIPSAPKPPRPPGYGGSSTPKPW